MKITISHRAEKQLRRASKIEQISIAKKIREIGKNKSKSKAEKLKGYEYIYRVRIGDYRIVYKKTLKELYIILIGHRKDIYKLLRQLLS